MPSRRRGGMVNRSIYASHFAKRGKEVLLIPEKMVRALDELWAEVSHRGSGIEQGPGLVSIDQ